MEPSASPENSDAAVIGHNDENSAAIMMRTRPSKLGNSKGNPPLHIIELSGGMKYRKNVTFVPMAVSPIGTHKSTSDLRRRLSYEKIAGYEPGSQVSLFNNGSTALALT